MSSDRSRLATRLALESFVIVASILAAFALDTWWDGRQEREEEQATLASLETEFVEAGLTIVRYRDLQARVLVSMSHLVREVEEAVAAGRTAAVLPDSALGMAYIPPTVSPQTGTRDGLVTSGRLVIIRDGELRSALAAWGGNLADLTEEEFSSKALVEGDLDRVMRSRGSTVGLWQVANDLLAGTLAPEEAGATREFTVDRELLGVLEMRRSILFHTINEYGDLEAELENILSLVGRSLNR